ncbi:MAG: 3-oxoadipyl-CoA thiolase [Betaproteobacteria bacterium]|jgi:acetyl-CoA C-acetyltransferase|nr:MAG: beta-ketoadipyl CoA thiolase [Betaproteobacteria bacterium SG8_41]UCF75261.1 MAG: 3-oxoadipyl-CoA thiolase [Betaproteobacteria bacterium]
MLNAYLYDGLRTPFGRHAGVLAKVRPDDLLADVMKAVMKKAAFKPEQIEDIVVGCANQGGEDSRCVARHAGLVAGLPIETPGTVLQRNCASGLGALAHAAHSVTAGEGEVFLVGGVESMSRSPLVLSRSESAFGRDVRLYDSTIGPRFSNPKLVKRFGDDQMPQTADTLAREYEIKREQADQFALRSQQRYAIAKGEGFFSGEISPVELPATRKGPVPPVTDDEHPRPNTDLATLAKMKTLYEGGVTTAGNASGVNDGAVALLVGSSGAGEQAGMKPLARVIATAAAGVPPQIMGIGPVAASKKALARAGLEIKDMDIIEINEAFAAQVLACLKGLGVAFDDNRVNPNGGAIAVGHPLGASGARLALTAARQLERSGGRYALVSLCIGGGQGMAAILERV